MPQIEVIAVPQLIEVVGLVNTTTVEVGDAQVVVSEMGAQGPMGATGGAYTHTQASAATTWTVNHNLGYRPAVTALTPGGAEMDVEIVHTSVNQALIYLAVAMAGTAVCS